MKLSRVNQIKGRVKETEKSFITLKLNKITSKLRQSPVKKATYHQAPLSSHLQKESEYKKFAPPREDNPKKVWNQIPLPRQTTST